MPSSPSEFLAVDVGDTRVGVARGSDAARLAAPLAVWPAGEAIERLDELAQQCQAAGIVVGLPRGLNGQETAQTAAVRAWAKRAKSQIDRPFYWQDEALTSRQAELEARSSNLGTRNSKRRTRSTDSEVQTPGLDADAAALILQDFLDTSEDDRVPI